MTGRQRGAQWLRRLADRLDPPEAAMRPDSLRARVHVLVTEADGAAPGTSGDYKRAQVYAQLRKEYPTHPAHALALLIEQDIAARRAA